MAKGMPWEKFWYQNFMDDLKICSAETRGFWISFLSYLWGSGGIGSFTGSITDFSRLTSCTAEEAERSIDELEYKNICEVKRECNGNVTIINRRLQNEEKERENTRLKVKEWRAKGNVTRHVTEKFAVEDRRKKIEDKNKGILLIGRAEPDNDHDASLKNQKETEEQRKRFSQAFTAKTNRLRSKYPRFNPQLFFQNHLNGHRDAILLCLDRLIEANPPISNPESYCEKIFSVESGNYFEAEAIKKHEEVKKETPTLQEALKGAINNAMSREVP